MLLGLRACGVKGLGFRDARFQNLLACEAWGFSRLGYICIYIYIYIYIYIDI